MRTSPMRTKFLAAAGVLIAAAAVTFAVAGTSSAAPAGAVVASDYSQCKGSTDATATVTCTLTSPVALAGGVTSFVTITGPSGGAVNLPASVRLNSYVIGDNGTPADKTDDVVTAVVWRVFGHQLVEDPNGNFRQNIYANLPISLDQKVTSGAGAYCAGNPCS